ncbi:hypothetical protein DYH09_06015 [bacterium CPR1]|nr:hypothetical protein [bacterium CPR1]
MLGSFLTDLLQRALTALEGTEAQYALCGGIAMILSGRDRSTRDLDVLVTVDSAQLDRLKEELRAQGFAHHDRADRHQLDDVLLLRFWLPIGTTGLSASLDVQLAQSGFSRQVVANARKESLVGHEIALATPEDLILLKLCAYRPVDRADAIELAQLHRDNLDRDYLLARARELAVADRLSEVLA